MKRARRSVLSLVATMLAIGTWPGTGRANQRCIDSTNPCEPDKLCTFKSQLAEKAFVHATYLANSQVTKRLGTRDTVRYDGRLHDAALAEARAAFPGASGADLQVKAGQIFEKKVRDYAEDPKNFKLPTCRLGGQLDRTLLPKSGYKGMYTKPAPSCGISVNYNEGDYDPNGFGSGDPTPCQEFYDRDLAHETIHQKRCEKAKAAGIEDLTLERVIEGEIAAYEHSVRLSAAYVKFLSILCTTLPNLEEKQRRANQIENLLQPYLNKRK